MANIIIYTKATCPFCTRAKGLLSKKNAAFTEIDIAGKDDIRSEMIAKAGGKSTVPQIFIDDKHIGGCDDLFALDAKGGLDPLLG